MTTAKEIFEDSNKTYDQERGRGYFLTESEYKLIKSERDEMIDFLVHLYVNYELPYGAMDVDTKQKFKQIIERSKGKPIEEILKWA